MSSGCHPTPIAYGVSQRPWQWLLARWVASTVAVSSATGTIHSVTPFASSSVFDGAGSVVARMVTPELNPLGMCHLMFALGDSAGAPSDKTVTVRVWGVKELSVGGVIEEVAHYCGDLALAGGTGAVHASSLLRSATLPTAFAGGAGVLGWVDTITISVDKFPLPFGAVVSHDTAECCAYLTLRHHGFTKFILEIQCGTAECCAAFYTQS